MTTYEPNPASSGELTYTWPVRRLGLKVQDLSASIDYYTRLGLSLVRDERNEGTAGLGFGTHEVLSLRLMANGRPRPRHTAGLYHFSLLLPGEADLGSFLPHTLDQRITLTVPYSLLATPPLYILDPHR